MTAIKHPSLRDQRQPASLTAVAIDRYAWQGAWHLLVIRRIADATRSYSPRRSTLAAFGQRYDHLSVSRVRPYLLPWVESAEASRHVASATALASFALESHELTEDHRRQLLNNAVWYVSEAAGKYKTRYRSGGVLALEAKAAVPKWRSELRHDHVTTRKAILERLTTQGADVPAILRSVVSCTVTKSEHERLTAFDETCDGWDRYLAAGVDVFDMATGEAFIRGGEFV